MAKSWVIVCGVLDRFRDAYVRYLQTSTNRDAVQVALSGSSLYSALNMTYSVLSIFANEYIDSDPFTIGELGNLSLFFDSEQDFESIAKKLNSLHEIYQQYCEITSIPEHDYPLKLSRIETGSLWIKLFGNSKVISLMEWSIKSAAAFLHRNYTREGRIGAIPKHIETLESILEIRARLTSQNIETSALDDQIKNASVKIGASLNGLLDKEPRIVVNGEVDVIVPDRRSLQMKAIPLLTDQRSSDAKNSVSSSAIQEKKTRQPSKPGAGRNRKRRKEETL
jgi:hypothetical protein